jgi:hypothetical protein
VLAGELGTAALLRGVGWLVSWLAGSDVVSEQDSRLMLLRNAAEGVSLCCM